MTRYQRFLGIVTFQAGCIAELAFKWNLGGLIVALAIGVVGAVVSLVRESRG